MTNRTLQPHPSSPTRPAACRRRADARAVSPGPAPRVARRSTACSRSGSSSSTARWARCSRRTQFDEDAFRGDAVRATIRATCGATTTCCASPSPTRSGRSTPATSTRAPTSSRPTRSPRRAIAQADYGLDAGVVREINVTAARLAREAADAAERADPDRPRFVAGALGPTNRTASISPDVDDPAARAVTWAELAGGLPRVRRAAWSTAAPTSC